MTIDISPQELGERLRIARETARITQAEAAGKIDVARTTLVAIEKGERRIRIAELQLLAGLYETSVNALLRREAVHLELAPRFRRISDVENPDVESAITTLNILLRADIELENILGISRGNKYPPEKNIQPGDVYKQAEEHAAFLRGFLGIGNGPIADIFSLIELGLGIRLYQRRLPPKISGLFIFEPGTGAAILLNSSHRLDRRSTSAAHELGHFVGTRRAPEVLEEDERFLSREERYANAFANYFLMPEEEVRKKFSEITAASSHLTRRHVILLCHYFGVSRQALVMRLEEVGLARKGTWDWFAMNGNISDEQAKAVLGEQFFRPDQGKIEGNAVIPPRIAQMAYQAWKKELLTEGQISELLHIKRVELRKLLDEYELEDSEDDAILELPH